ncbi:hypothetical protein GPECTOR_97g751 [Gonium pectorale]|uniref:Phosphodiesterase n=1 Tax=Gonium pectorale TaxID=33097 RepID=A0A150G009_GONPE|nr:hypothetical protein GPECTOR_97g751 [Gonium pectorale]|eukprot:KXZ43213.1 hypothetical protein GPECTOR_97g751 [Gonium pectorale]
MEESVNAKLAQLQAELDSLHKVRADQQRMGKLSFVLIMGYKAIEILQAITVLNQLAAELDIHTAMQNVRQVALELLDCERVTLFLIFDRRGELRAMIDQSEILRIQFGEGIAGLVAQTGGSMNLPDVYEHPMFNKEVDRLTGFRTRSMLCMAISDMTGKNVAVLQALNKNSEQPFTPADERNLKLFGTHLGNTLVKAKLHETAKREKERLQAIYTCFKSLSTAEEVGQMVVCATAALERHIIHADRVFFFLVDAPRGELWLHTHQAEPVRLRVGDNGGVVGRCAESKKPQSWADFGEAGQDPALSRLAPVLAPARIKSVLVQPIHGTNNDRVLAVVLAINKREAEGTNDIFFEPFFTDADCDAMALFAYEVGDLLSERSLELSLLSALSVVGHNGAHPNAAVQAGHEGDAAASEGGAGPSGSLPAPGSLPGSEDLIRSQLIQMYLPEFKNSVWASNRVQASRADDAPAAAAPVAEGGEAAGSPFMKRESSTAAGDFPLPELGSLRCASSSLAEHPVMICSDGSPMADGLPCGRSGRSLTAASAPATGSAQTLRPVRTSGAWPGARPRDASPPSPLPQQHSPARRPQSLQLDGHQHVSPWQQQDSQRDGDAHAFDEREQGPGGGTMQRHMAPCRHPLPAMPAKGDDGACAGVRPISKTASLSGGNSEGEGDGGEGRRLDIEDEGSDAELADEAAGQQPNGDGGGEGKGDGDGGERTSPSRRHARGRHRMPTLTERLSTCDDVEAELLAAAEATLHAGVADPQALRTHLSCSNLTQSGSPRSPCFYTREQLYSWDWDFIEFNVEALIKLAYDIFILSGAMEEFELKPKVLRNFLTAVASHYHAIPYHNFNHVCHVLHATFLISCTTRVRDVLKPVERLALLLAALCHDLDHDGHSNQFHINSQSELARIYNDQSVMENHHCAMAFAILSRTDCNVLATLPADEQRAIRKAVISSILCTDMANHFTLTQEFQKHNVVYDPENESDRVLLSKVVLHAADIGNAVRPFHVNHAMSRRVHREFESQADEEVRLGLPVTFPVNTADHVMCARVELNFLDYVVTTLWERLVDVLPELEPQMHQLRVNRARYRIIADTGKTADQVLAEEQHPEQALASDTAAQLEQQPVQAAAAGADGAPSGVAHLPDASSTAVSKAAEVASAPACAVGADDPMLISPRCTVTHVPNELLETSNPVDRMTDGPPSAV